MTFGRQPKQNKGKQKIKELEVAMQNVQMATQISQMMLKQILDQFQGMRRDLDNSMGILNDCQYRTQAIMELTGLDINKLNELAEGYKLNDYMKASDAEDEVKGYELDNDGVIDENSVVIITSSTNGDEDKGIFRSKFAMPECQTDSLREQLLGKKVGDTFDEEINGDVHKIEILGLRKVTVQEVEGENEDNGEEDKSN